MEERRDYEEMEIDLRELFQIIKKRLSLIFIITLIAAMASGIVSFFVITPIYQASTELLVNKSDAEMNAMYSYNDIQTNLKLIETYSVIIKSPRIIDKVISDYHLEMSSQELTDKVSVNAVKNSQVMAITVQDPDQTTAAKLANAVAYTFKTEILKIMKVDNVQILTQAKEVEEPSPIKPKPMLNMAIAFVVGIMAAVGIVFLMEYLDNSIKSEQEIERLLGYPVLGSIATIEENEPVNNAKSQRMSRSMKFSNRGEANEI